MFGEKIKPKRFQIEYEILDYLLPFFGEKIMQEGKIWNDQHMNKIERVTEKSIKEEESIKNMSIKSNDLDHKKLCRGEHLNIISFIQGFYYPQHNFEIDKNIFGFKNLNLDSLLLKDFSNLEQGKKPIIFKIIDKNFAQNPYYYINKALCLYQIQKRNNKENFITSKTLMNVINIIL